MKKILLFISLILVSSYSFPQSAFDKLVSDASKELANKLMQKNKKKIVVLYVTDIGKTQTVAGKYMADVISVDIVNNDWGFEVFDRENLSGIAEAKKLIAEGYIDVDKAKALGKILSVEAIIIGNYTVLSKKLKLTLKAFDSNTGLVISAIGKELPIDLDTGVLLGINIDSRDVNALNRGFNNRPLNSNENYNNPETVNQDCEVNNTGDYCFTNNTPNEIHIQITGSLDMRNFVMTLQAGQTQCFYNLKAQKYRYSIQQSDFVNTTDRRHNAKQIKRRGEILVEKCKSKSFSIK